MVMMMLAACIECIGEEHYRSESGCLRLWFLTGSGYCYGFSVGRYEY